MIRLASRTAAQRSRRAGSTVALLVFGGLAGCGGDGPTVPEAEGVSVAALAGDGQLGAAGLRLVDPLQVVVRDPVSRKPVAGARVRYAVREGAQATVSPAEATTDDYGIASATLVLGSALGTYRVEVTAEGMVGESPSFSAEAVPVPNLAAVSPELAAAGETVTLTGTNFRPTAAENRVTMGELDARVISASATTLRVEVPACVPNRTLDVRVRVGSAVSGARVLAARAASAALALQPGQVKTFRSAQELVCVQLAGHAAGAGYYVSVLNAADAAGPATPFNVVGLLPGSVSALAVPGAERLLASDPALAFEASLRAWERTFPPDAMVRTGPGLQALVRVPEVGDQATFNVINSDNRFEKVSAVVKAVSQKAVIYQDLAAPAGGFTTADFQSFGALFDNPIHATVAGVFGQPSDIDANGRVTILFTPSVNALTDAGQSSFIAGYFFGCDLVAASTCSGTNRGEIFYSMVPDPAGALGNVRSTSLVLRTVPGVLAHEFQHMINFNVKNGKQDALWLSEALAHAAEDLVGQELLALNRTTEAEDFLKPNWNRARQYLAGPASVSLLLDQSPGTLAFRGGAWLLLRYAAAHHGGHDLYRQLAVSPLTSVANFEGGTGRPWEEMLADFSVALWADGASELTAAVDARHTFPDLDLRATVGGGSYPLRPTSRSFTDFAFARSLLPASFEPFLLTGPGSAPPFHLVVAGAAGAPFQSGAAPAMAVLRYR